MNKISSSLSAPESSISKTHSAQDWIDYLGLVRHIEGGYYKEIYKSDEVFTDLPKRYNNETRTHSTAIYFLLDASDFSTFHVLQTDELWHFCCGSPLTIYLIDDETGNLETAHLGPQENNKFFFRVPRGRIYAIRLKDPQPGDYTLVCTTVSPGFEYSDFAFRSRTELLEKFPQHEKLILELTRE